MSFVVRDTGIEPVTSSVSGKRSPAELIARGGDGNRTRVHGFAGRCLTTRPLHRKRSSPTSRADDGIRTRDPHLGKVMRYQLRYIRIRTVRRRALRGAVQNISRLSTQHTNCLVIVRIDACVAGRFADRWRWCTTGAVVADFPTRVRGRVSGVPPAPRCRRARRARDTRGRDGGVRERTRLRPGGVLRLGALPFGSVHAAEKPSDLAIRVRRESVLVFHSVRAAAKRHGPVAQWKSVPFTPGRSLVRSQPGPQ